jgi:hypothetical protein
MNRLGRKITGGVKKLGKKVDGTAHMLGKKADGVINKAESLNNQVLKQSGALLNGVDKGLTVGTRILSAANAAGLGAVPGIGQASMALERGGKTALSGVNAAKEIRKDYKQESKRAFDKAHKGTNQLEKFNSRKMAAKVVRDAQEEYENNPERTFA